MVNEGRSPFALNIFFYFSQIYNLLCNGVISKYVVRKHLCGAIEAGLGSSETLLQFSKLCMMFQKELYNSIPNVVVWRVYVKLDTHDEPNRKRELQQWF
jgi:hypothetical protein